MAESYPAFRAGQKVSGELLASMLPRTARKVTDSTMTSTTVASDPELSLTVEANAVYEMNGLIYCNNTTSVSDIVIDFDAPSGTDGTWSGVGRAVNVVSGTDSGDAKLIGSAITASRSFGTNDAGAGAPTIVQLTSTLIVGSTAGSYTVQYALLNAGGTLTVYSDSFITLRRIS